MPTFSCSSANHAPVAGLGSEFDRSWRQAGPTKEEIWVGKSREQKWTDLGSRTCNPRRTPVVHATGSKGQGLDSAGDRRNTAGSAEVKQGDIASSRAVAGCRPNSSCPKNRPMAIISSVLGIGRSLSTSLVSPFAPVAAVVRHPQHPPKSTNDCLLVSSVSLDPQQPQQLRNSKCRMHMRAQYLIRNQPTTSGQEQRQTYGVQSSGTKRRTAQQAISDPMVIRMFDAVSKEGKLNRCISAMIDGKIRVYLYSTLTQKTSPHLQRTRFLPSASKTSSLRSTSTLYYPQASQNSAARPQPPPKHQSPCVSKRQRTTHPPPPWQSQSPSRSSATAAATAAKRSTMETTSCAAGARTPTASE
ncbi:hypothetical protein MBM_02871 [Drepanopeziza brunnea f. sp. 'multigermtubi' MB_m1]|uniref:Uncharacterized protein n=1 Tax=Marssonina brunnea f. sp. multigermtubi (strain MB_m1) TaxID=1072389 RepID=K1Y0J1_MARBU|nr:uncharacterized protein MBM_02871 [Drepanopeziza brunnea f. sp. 'multigermtubi' MB_m1]EKD18629.1 hypothetical protein MBM_02871 [Drepanopeziza brunnea f. sp. 'multigermtubi' MB_m1]